MLRRAWMKEGPLSMLPKALISYIVRVGKLGLTREELAIMRIEKEMAEQAPVVVDQHTLNRLRLCSSEHPDEGCLLVSP